MFKPHYQNRGQIFRPTSQMDVNSNHFNPYQTSNNSYGAKISKSYGMPSQSYNTMKGHIKNIRRVEPDSILKNYRDTSSNFRYNGIYPSNPKVNSNGGAAPIYATQNTACEGEDAAKRVQARVQESLRKRGCLVGGQKVKMVKKPEEAPASQISGLNRRQVCNDRLNQGLLMATKVAQPPSVKYKRESHESGKNQSKNSKVTVENVEYIKPKEGSGKVQEESKQIKSVEKPVTPPSSEYVYKNLTVEEDKENVIRSGNLSMFGHGDLRKMNKRCLKEQIKNEIQDNKKTFKNASGKSSQGNPLQADMEKANKQPSELIEKQGSYQTTSGSTYKRWQKSAFQTVTSRLEERPYWANPNVSQGHFVRKLNNNQPTKKIPNPSNLGLTLSITGNNIYQGPFKNKNKRMTNVLNNGSTKKNAFKSEYMRTFGSELSVR